MSHEVLFGSFGWFRVVFRVVLISGLVYIYWFLHIVNYFWSRVELNSVTDSNKYWVIRLFWTPSWIYFDFYTSVKTVWNFFSVYIRIFKCNQWYETEMEGVLFYDSLRKEEIIFLTKTKVVLVGFSFPPIFVSCVNIQKFDL